MEGKIPNFTCVIFFLTNCEVLTENNGMVLTELWFRVFSFYITSPPYPLTFVKIIALEYLWLVFFKKSRLKCLSKQPLKETNMYKAQKSKKKILFVLYIVINKLMW